MTNITVSQPAARKWSKRTFYVSDEMAEAAHRVSQQEERDTGRRVGAGQIVTRALREYLERRYTPHELTELLNGRTHAQ